MPPKRAPPLTPAEALVKKVWTDPATGFASAAETLRRAKLAAAEESIAFPLKLKDVRALLAGYEAVQLNAPRRKVKHWSRFTTKRVNESHQLDLLDLDKEGFGAEKGGDRYLMIAVDVHSPLQSVRIIGPG
jgi:hypothetical protein